MGGAGTSGPCIPGGELAILTFTGEDNTTEFAMLHSPDVVEKYATDAIRGVVGNGKSNRPGSREVGLACFHRYG